MFVHQPFLSHPYGLPNYWKNETSGKLKEVVEAYLEASLDKSKSMTEGQIFNLVIYLTQYIFAPCWERDDCVAELECLRSQVADITTIEDIDRWLEKALLIGIDPL